MFHNLQFSSTYVILLIFSTSCVFGVFIDELKSIHFEVSLLQKPLPKDQELSSFIQMTTKKGQNYNCLLPQLEDTGKKVEDTENEKNINVLDLLKPMKNRICLYKTKDWWTYEFCFGYHIKQFHIEEGNVVGEVNYLGLFESDYDWNNETEPKNSKLNYHSQMYTNGSNCVLTEQPRTSEVRFYCEEGAHDYIFRVDEPGTCSYLFTVHTARLCTHPRLKAPPTKKALPIACHPVLSDQQYAEYLQKAEKSPDDADEQQTLNFMNIEESHQSDDSNNEEAKEHLEIKEEPVHEEMSSPKKVGV